MASNTIATIDPWLEPYVDKLEARHEYIEAYASRILGKASIRDFSLGYLYFGLHKTEDGWVFREWAPNATSLYLISENTSWQDSEKYALEHFEDGVWEVYLPEDAFSHGDHYKLRIHWDGGSAERIPAYATYVVQDEKTHGFDAVVWHPKAAYKWKNTPPTHKAEPLLIYEAHVGMSGDREGVTSYTQFTEETLPRIKDLGYSTIQLMAVQEHPYYGSFGYHVSNFFAASSRFGTPDDLKKLIDTAHGMGLRVVLDIVHSHAVKNENEGLSRFDGTLHQYFHEGARGNHDAWDSRVFNYGNPKVVHFLLSNVRFWLEEYRFDGFRFDGVTSMLYRNHGLGQDFSSYDDYFGDNIDEDAVGYLSLATQIAHSVNPETILIAEDMSAFPGLATPISQGGIGFSHRLSMGMPDFWIKTLKEKRDEEWNLAHLFHELTTHRPEETTISYAESHDQALVGDKTLIFQLIDKDMYEYMSKDHTNLAVERGIALHKMIRLLTFTTQMGGYLNFMGNEFGHPEWIDFPREGNEWSYKYARRQWSLVDDTSLRYSELHEFDRAMKTITPLLGTSEYHWVSTQQEKGILSYSRGAMLCVFNTSPSESYVDLEIPTFDGSYSLVLSTDDVQFGGQGRVLADAPYIAKDNILRVYIPSRVGLIFKRSV